MHQILLDIPVPITTDRLLLRPPQPGDGIIVNKAVVESFDELKPWLPWAQQLPSIEASETWCRESIAEWALRTELPLLVFDHDNNLLGSSGFNVINWEVPSVEIGYWIRTSCTEKGYATEAVTALCHYAFKQLKVKRVGIRCDEDNKPSRRIPLKLGFEEEGIFRFHDIKPDGSGPRTAILYARFNLLNLPSVTMKRTTP